MEISELVANINQPVFEDKLTQVYGSDRLESAKSRCTEVTEGFRQTFGYSAQALFSAPGRTELGGNHTDHQRGCVLAAAVDLDILAASAVTDSGVIRVLSQGYPMTEVSLRELTPQEGEKNTSAALIRGVASRMQEMGCDLRGRGLDVYMTSTVPKGSGLSSSAAYEVLMGTMLNELLWERHCTPVELAQIGQYAENVFFGKPCGLMDQTACAVGGVITIDFKDPSNPVVGQTAIDLAKHGFVMCISDTKGSHADLTDDYAAIRREMESVAAQFGKKVLRDVDEDEFYKAIPQLRKAVGDRAVVRAIHFYNDCRRAAQLCDAVRDDDFDTFLKLIIEGGHSSFEFNQNAYSIKAPKEQGVPLALALSQKVLNGRGAWRLQGGGFAGTIQAFVPVDLLDTYKAAIDGCFGEGSCHVLNIRNYGAVPVTPDM